MKTSVKNIMMSFALMGCLIFSASDAMAQGRSRSQGGSTSSRSQSAAVSRTNNATAPTVTRSTSSNSSSSVSRSSATPQVNRSTSSSSSSSVSRSSATPQVNRSSSSSSSSSVSRNSATPQVNRSTSSSSSSSVARPSSNSQINRPSSTTSSRPGNSSSSGNGVIKRDGNSSSNDKATGTVARPNNKDVGTINKKADITKRDQNSSSSIGTTSGKPIGKPNGNDIKPNGKPDGKPNGNDIKPNGKPDGKPNGNDNGHRPNGKPDGKPNGNDNGHRPNGHKPGGHDGNDRPGYNNNNHFDYTNHHYYNEFHWNYSHHNWSRPLPPPARPYRPAPLVWYRPVIPTGWYPYAGAPVIDRILGITFGTLFDTSLDYLFYNGYEIDGYGDGIIYLRNVPLLDFIWDDVMLCYDSDYRLANAQFIFHTTANNHRYHRVYRNLCRVYGEPIVVSSHEVSWYGGNRTGWVTLSTTDSKGHYYTTLSIGY